MNLTQIANRGKQMENEINFDVSKKDMRFITEIVKRARDLGRKYEIHVDGCSLHMDLCAAHNQCPLKLEELLNADDSNFTHDVFGIRNHMDRRTGKITDCFLPRYAA